MTHAADHGLFTAGWSGVREKHCFWLEIYDRLRASEQEKLIEHGTICHLEKMDVIYLHLNMFKPNKVRELSLPHTRMH